MEDVAEKKGITMSQAAKILDLNYHTARKKLMASERVGCFDYDGKRLWVLDDVLNFKRSKYIAPIEQN